MCIRKRVVLGNALNDPNLQVIKTERKTPRVPLVIPQTNKTNSGVHVSELTEKARTDSTGRPGDPDNRKSAFQQSKL